MWKELVTLFKSEGPLQEAFDEAVVMLQTSHGMYRDAVAALRGEGHMEVDIYERDRELNKYERSVRRKIVTHMSVSAKPDINLGLVLTAIVIDIERIGDYSKNITDLAVAHPKKLTGGPVEGAVTSVETQALSYFDRTVQTFRAGDIDEARKLMRDYKEEISSQCSEITRRIVAGEIELPAADAAALALYLRCLKRICAHSRNLVSSLVNPFDRIGYME